MNRETRNLVDSVAGAISLERIPLMLHNKATGLESGSPIQTLETDALLPSLASTMELSGFV